MPTLLFMTSHPTPSPSRAPIPDQTTGTSALGRALATGSLMVGAVTCGVVAGVVIDAHTGSRTHHWWTLGLGIAGVIQGLYLVVRSGSRP